MTSSSRRRGGRWSTAGEVVLRFEDLEVLCQSRSLRPTCADGEQRDEQVPADSVSRVTTVPESPLGMLENDIRTVWSGISPIIVGWRDSGNKALLGTSPQLHTYRADT
jgi:hypothetical protein